MTEQPRRLTEDDCLYFMRCVLHGNDRDEDTFGPSPPRKDFDLMLPALKPLIAAVLRAEEETLEVAKVRERSSGANMTSLVWTRIVS